MTTNGHNGATPQPFAAVQPIVITEKPRRTRKAKTATKRFEVHYCGGVIMRLSASDEDAAKKAAQDAIPAKEFARCEVKEAK